MDEVEDRLKQESIPFQVGHRMVSVAEEVLVEQLGREPAVKELAEFGSVMASQCLIGGYLALREKYGPKDAEMYLRKTLALAATGIRMSGSEAFVKVEISVSDFPNRLSKKVPPKDAGEKLAEALAPAAPCNCKRDGDGRCLTCSEAISLIYQKFFLFFREIGQFKDSLKEICPSCQHDQMDYALSKTIPAVFEVDIEPDKMGIYAHEVLPLLHQMAMLQGVREIPLTIQAWKDYVAAKGIEVKAP